MIRFPSQKPLRPIGIDIGHRSVKLVQLGKNNEELTEAVRWELPEDISLEDPDLIAQALAKAREGRRFRGKTCVLSLGGDELFIQSVRIPKSEPEQVKNLIHQEAAGKLPFPIQEGDLRYLQAGEVRQGTANLKEYILFGCHREVLQRKLKAVTQAGLLPVGVDAEPLALLRGCLRQFRRDGDDELRNMFVHFGYTSSVVVIADGDQPLFIKYINLGGKHLDQAVAKYLKMDMPQAIAFRKHNGDRRADQQDPEVNRSVSEAIRPIVEQASNELGLCVRYQAVTFRGKQLHRLMLGGGEATPQLLEGLTKSLNVRSELSDPLRGCSIQGISGRNGQWEIATGLALKPVELN